VDTLITSDISTDVTMVPCSISKTASRARSSVPSTGRYNIVLLIVINSNSSENTGDKTARKMINKEAILVFILHFPSLLLTKNVMTKFMIPCNNENFNTYFSNSPRHGWCGATRNYGKVFHITAEIDDRLGQAIGLAFGL